MTHILLISGSVRAGSTNQALLATAALVAPAGMTTSGFGGLGALPHFNPDLDVEPLPIPVVDLRRQIAAADALLFCTPEYAGALPGAFKNLLDWTVGGIEISDKPTGWINVSTAPLAAAGAHQELGTVLRYTGARIISEACVHLPVNRTQVDGGVIADPAIRAAVASALEVLAHAARVA